MNKRLRAWAAFTGGLLLAAAGAGGPSAAHAQSTQYTSPPAGPEKREGFYDLDQLERLFHIAREAGFSEQELQGMTIQDEEGKTVNAWEYLQESKRRLEMRDKDDQEKLRKLYITIQDILSDLQRREREDLRKLRDETVYPE